MKNVFLLFFILQLGLQVQCSNISDTTKQHVIPFKLVHNKVLVPVTIGDSRIFDLILDSGFGFEGMILFKRELADSISLVNRIMVRIPGAGDGPPSQAIMSDGMKFRSGTREFDNQRVIILQNELFKNSESDGVIGYSFFGHHKVEVNYDNKVIILYEPDEIINDTEWEAILLNFDTNNKPHLNIYLSVAGEESALIDVYIDYASSMSIELAIKEGMKFPLPDKYDSDYGGYGLSGEVHGKNARISSFKIGKYEFKNATATFFEGDSRSKDKYADGVISNDALRRFNLIFDYQNKRLLIKPNNSFNEPFEFIN